MKEGNWGQEEVVFVCVFTALLSAGNAMVGPKGVKRCPDHCLCVFVANRRNCCPLNRIHYLPTYIHPTIQHMHALGGQKEGKTMEVECKWGGLNDSYPFRVCRKGLEAIL